MLVAILIGGCGQSEEKIAKKSDVDYTVVPSRDCPEELARAIEEKKEGNFQLSYLDGEYLYLAVGYGEQETGGYRILAKELGDYGEYLQFQTELQGPSQEIEKVSKKSYPYLVIKTERTEREIHYKI